MEIVPPWSYDLNKKLLRIERETRRGSEGFRARSLIEVRLP